ncbi:MULTISPECIES: factor-independent urate hydroxylase [Sorangium]|uniref:Uricase n=1 Tax=Sorangium cellulosum TaxID=56 RepID=A0A4P2QRL7_SORCE|nr:MULTISPECIES: urate oxidase [Sorangium]AUX32937.1 urate oxidase [Sorangium cellulosum]WCQ92313.1 Uricase [Sorangium sp. Soce836]
MSISLVRNSYGKSRVRLVKVRRADGRHELTDIDVDIELEGDFDDAYTRGDNSKVLPTDTMKNTVYALAKGHPVEPIEDFGVLLAEHFLGKAHTRRARVAIAENVWSRIDAGGAPHRHAFLRAGAERRTAEITAASGGVEIVSGIADLLVLKTGGSAFSGFPRDQYTTLKETDDRILSTLILARWRAAARDEAPTATWERARRALLETFAEQHSLSVQHTMHALGEAVLAACPAVDELSLSLPNKHCLLVDLSRFGLGNDNEIFVPVDEPHGLIHATMKRGG